MDKKKTKKSKKGKKNWRKNIDVTEIEEKEALFNKKQREEKEIENLKDEDLFDFDFEGNKNKMIGKKKKREEEKKIFKENKNEKKLIKQIIESKKFQQKETKEENKIKDLWEDETEGNKTKSKKEISLYPKVPIAHPGQSYNPEKKDVQNLLNKVVELNQFLVKEEENKEPNEDYFKSEESSEEEEIDLNNIKISNNPAVDDSNRLTRKQKRQKEIKKANRLKNKEEVLQKIQRKIIHNVLSNKKLIKEKEENQKKIEEEKKKEAEKKKQKESLIKNGIVNDDRKFFEDFQINKGGISLRTMQSNNNSLGERWDNILKRNVLGEYSRDNKINKRNRKLKQMHIIDLKNRDDIFLEDEDKLKIIE